MNVRLRMYQVLLFKFGRHLCKGSLDGVMAFYIYLFETRFKSSASITPKGNIFQITLTF